MLGAKLRQRPERYLCSHWIDSCQHMEPIDNISSAGRVGGGAEVLCSAGGRHSDRRSQRARNGRFSPARWPGLGLYPARHRLGLQYCLRGAADHWPTARVRPGFLPLGGPVTPTFSGTVEARLLHPAKTRSAVILRYSVSVPETG